MADDVQRQLRAYVEYFRDLGVYDFYRRGEPGTAVWPESVAAVELERVSAPVDVVERTIAAVTRPVARSPVEGLGLKLVSFNDLAPLPEVRVAVEHRAEALKGIQEEIGDCTRCPLAYAGRRKIVFGDGDPKARLMFVGEGPGADEDASGVPFVGKAGQLLNNMINAMGLKREEVYIANVVKCRPPANRVPEPVEANTCSQFLLRQLDVVQPQVVVALGSTAASYLLGVKQSLAGLRGRWHSCRGAKLAVTYHPAFLLRDPRQKGEAWKDLQMVMAELGLKAKA
ncbi:uracil-DNA glycosylase [Granulicella sp. dw_53]|uniref:uracil-DNA glycosylase n=1 Tax=Granulicella sp. dw_53 TaxID=2719792 RepID=UPI001BD5AF70|nr:uracil-DNA glycosylase [Granulicella sp. dw_53]